MAQWNENIDLKICENLEQNNITWDNKKSERLLKETRILKEFFLLKVVYNFFSAGNCKQLIGSQFNSLNSAFVFNTSLLVNA